VIFSNPEGTKLVRYHKVPILTWRISLFTTE